MPSLKLLCKLPSLFLIRRIQKIGYKDFKVFVVCILYDISATLEVVKPSYQFFYILIF